LKIRFARFLRLWWFSLRDWIKNFTGRVRFGLIGPIGWFVEFVVFVGGFEFFHSTFDVGRSMFDVRFFSPSNPRILGSFSYEHRMSTLEGQKPEFCTATGLPFT
jgi:hypothetical protein